MLNAPVEDGRTSVSAGLAPSEVALTPTPEPESDGPLPRIALVYVFAVFAAGIAAIGWYAPQLDTSDLPGFLILAVLAVVFGRTKIQLYGETTVSVAIVGNIAVAFLFGPAGTAIVSPIAAIATDVGSVVWYKRLFNIGLVVVDIAIAAGIRFFLDLQGPGLPVNLWLIPIAAGAIIAFYLLNITLVALAVSLSTRTPILAVFREKFEWLLPHYVMLGFLGLALAVAYHGLGVAGILAFVAPPLMMRLSIKQYVDKTAENVEELKRRNRELQTANRDITRMADQLRDTYDGTLEALVSALDARDRETKGHSLRVAKYMMEIAYHLGVEPGTDDWVNMQRGGLLHDIGKIGVSDSILHKPGPLTDEEWVDMRRHPQIGHDMIREIGFLSGAATIVLAHHERFDGKGYPRGLAADEIPLGARIFVLADTFDAMTSDRPYRAALSCDAARDEIIRCSGTQFDPRCVQAFLLAWDRIVEIRQTDHEEEGEHHAAAAPRQQAA